MWDTCLENIYRNWINKWRWKQKKNGTAWRKRWKREWNGWSSKNNVTGEKKHTLFSSGCNCNDWFGMSQRPVTKALAST